MALIIRYILIEFGSRITLNLVFKAVHTTVIDKSLIDVHFSKYFNIVYSFSFLYNYCPSSLMHLDHTNGSLKYSFPSFPKKISVSKSSFFYSTSSFLSCGHLSCLENI